MLNRLPDQTSLFTVKLASVHSSISLGLTHIPLSLARHSRKSLQIFECLLFETDDLIMRKNEKHVILCLLEVARRGAKFGKLFVERTSGARERAETNGDIMCVFVLVRCCAGMLAPMLVQMERQIDREIAADNRAAGVSCDTQTEASNGDATQSGAGGVDASVGTDAQELFDSDTEDEEDEPVLMYGPQPQIVTNDLKSLDEMVSVCLLCILMRCFGRVKHKLRRAQLAVKVMPHTQTHAHTRQH